MSYACRVPPMKFRCDPVDPMFRRFSKPWWISLASASCVFGLVMYLLLRWIGTVDDDRLALYLIAGIALGDAFLAWTFEIVTPTRVTLGPGERRFASSELREPAEVVSGFDGSSVGRVRARGEIWSARTADGHPVRLDPGAQVAVVEREDLTLLVDAGGETP